MKMNGKCYDERDQENILEMVVYTDGIAKREKRACWEDSHDEEMNSGKIQRKNRVGSLEEKNRTR